MNKKQTIRTLGSIENKQPKQPKQPKKSTKVIENESDDNIEVNSEPEEEEYIEQPPEGNRKIYKLKKYTW